MSMTAIRVMRPGAASGGRRARPAGCRRSSPPSSRVCRTVAEPMCGTTSRFGASSSGSSAGSGSGSVTSSAAPAIAPSCSAVRSASWSTTPPRAVLIEQRRRLHLRRARPRRSDAASPGVSGVWTETKSERPSSSSSGTPDERELWTISIPKPSARRATAWPIRPQPTMPSVCPGEVGAETGRRLPGAPAARAHASRRRARSAARAPAAARTPRRPWRRSARRACCRPGCRAPPRPRGRCCRSRRPCSRSPSSSGRRRAAPRPRDR